MRWFDIIPYQNTLQDPYEIKDNKSLYFRLSPIVYDWMNLIMMGVLLEVNQIFRVKERSDTLMFHCLSLLSDEHKTFTYYFNRVKYLIKSVFVYFVLCVMLYLQKEVQTNLINWTFFIVNVLNAAMMISGNKSKESYNRS